MCSPSTVVAHSLDNVLFRDALHCSLMTDGGGYAYFSRCYHFIAPYVCTAQYLVKQTLCSSFILIYFPVNSYIVNKALKSMGAQPPEIEHHIKETVGLRKPETIGLYHRHTPEVSTPGEPLGSRG